MGKGEQATIGWFTPKWRLSWSHESFSEKDPSPGPSFVAVVQSLSVKLFVAEVSIIGSRVINRNDMGEEKLIYLFN